VISTKKNFKQVSSTEFVPRGKHLRFVSLLTILTLVMAAMVSSGAFVYIAYASPTSSFYVEEGIYPGAPTYTVWREDSTYYAKDANGHIPTWGASSNASLLINNTFGDLTAGRTWQEKVLLKGNFEVDLMAMGSKKAAIQISSYTLLEIQGKITLKDSQTTTGAADNYVISNADHTNGNGWIEIYGGEIDVNKAGNPGKEGEIYGIELSKVWDVIIDGIYVHDSHETGIAIEGGSYDVIVKNCRVSDTGYDGIGVGGFGAINYRIWFVNNYITGTIPYHAITVERQNHQVHVVGNIIDYTTENAGSAGIHLDATYNVEVKGNIIRNRAQYGIRIVGNSTYPARSVIISENIIYQSSGDTGGHGIFLSPSTANGLRNILIVDNDVRNMQGDYSGIVLGNYVQNVTVIGNYVYDDQGTATQDYGITEISGADYNYIISNVAIGNQYYGIRKFGANTEVHACMNGTSWIA